MAKKSENPFETAEALLENGKPEDALKILRKTWDAENESPKTYKLAGDAKIQMASLTDSLFEKKKLLRDGLKQYTKSLKLDPKNKQTYEPRDSHGYEY